MNLVAGKSGGGCVIVTPKFETDSEDASEAPRLLSILRQGTIVRGLVGPEPVTVLVATGLTGDSANVLYKTEAGVFGDSIAFANDVDRHATNEATRCARASSVLDELPVWKSIVIPLNVRAV